MPTAEEALTALERERDLLKADEAEAEARRIADEIAAKASAIEAKITTIHLAKLTLERTEAQIAADLRWRETLAVIRAQCASELLLIPKRSRDALIQGRQQNLRLSMITIDRGLYLEGGFSLATLRLGQLILEAGYPEGPKVNNQTFGEVPWFGSLDETERRLEKLRTERDDAQARLNSALLTDEERAAQLAEIKTRNAQPIRRTRPDGSVYLRWPDGRREEVE